MIPGQFANVAGSCLMIHGDAQQMNCRPSLLSFDKSLCNKPKQA